MKVRKVERRDKALLDIPVVCEPLVTRNPAYWGVDGGHGYAIIRTDIMKTLATVSYYYEFVTHRQVVERLEKALSNEGVDFRLFDINIGGIGQNRIFLNYELPSYSFDIEGDVFIPFIQIFSSYDRYMSFGAISGVYRADNYSAIIVPKGLDLIQRRHLKSKGIKTEASLRKMIDIGTWVDGLVSLRGALKILKLKELNPAMIEHTINLVFDKKNHQRMFKASVLLEDNIKEFGYNQYAFLNALSEYATHGIMNEKRRRSYDKSREAQVLLGKLFLNMNKS